MNTNQPTTKYHSRPSYLTEEGEQYEGKRRNKSDRYFASQWEYDVYKELLTLFPKESIVRQFVIHLIPKNYDSPGIIHLIDFMVLGLDGKPQFYVEAKGFTTETYKIKLQLLRHFYPLIWRELLVVHKYGDPKPIGSSRKKTVSLPEMTKIINSCLFRKFKP